MANAINSSMPPKNIALSDSKIASMSIGSSLMAGPTKMSIMAESMMMSGF